MEGDTVTKRLGEHSHVPSAASAEAISILHRVRQEATATHDAPMQIITGSIRK